MAAKLPLHYAFLPAKLAVLPARPPPLLLLLHGTGDNERGLLSVGAALQRNAPASLAVASLRAPLDAPGGGFRWFAGYTAAPQPGALDRDLPAARALVLQFALDAPAVLSTDPTRTFILGFSQGATVGWSVMTASWPRADAIAGALLFSGRLFPQHAEPNHPLALGSAGAGELRSRRVWATHGTADLVTPIQLARDSERVAGRLWGGDDGAPRVEDHFAGHELPERALEAAARVLRGWGG